MAGLGTKGKLGIVFALREEAVGLERVLAESRSVANMPDGRLAWLIGQLEVHTIISGIGASKCAKAVEKLISSGSQWVIAAGFAAALDPAIKVGDVIVGNRVINTDIHKGVFHSDRMLISLLPPHRANADFAIRICDLVSTDSIISTPQQKHNIYQSTGAGALDMESYTAAMICSEHNVPFAAIRSISDSASDSISDPIITLASIENRLRQILYIAGRPQAWKCILDMRRKTNLAANNLADVLGFMLLRMI